MNALEMDSSKLRLKNVKQRLQVRAVLYQPDDSKQQAHDKQHAKCSQNDCSQTYLLARRKIFCCWQDDTTGLIDSVEANALLTAFTHGLQHQSCPDPVCQDRAASDARHFNALIGVERQGASNTFKMDQRRHKFDAFQSHASNDDLSRAASQVTWQ